MLRSRFVVAIVSAIALLMMMGANAQTTTTVIEKRVVVSPAPKAVCSSVAGHWEGNVWVDAHNVCKYENRAEGVAWVDDYWSCTAVMDNGTCTNWVLVPGHWVKTLS